ncbi:hypothetical protein ACFL2T_06665 [Elusimicrobiota bacterium]
MFCTKCGAENAEHARRCVSCKGPINPVAYIPPNDDGVGGLIPYKNTKALIAYYLGVFSLIPCLGLLLGIGAFILGLLGLAHAKKHPESGGKAHAWIGIVVGGLCAVANIAGIILMSFS